MKLSKRVTGGRSAAGQPRAHSYGPDRPEVTSNTSSVIVDGVPFTLADEPPPAHGGNWGPSPRSWRG